MRTAKLAIECLVGLAVLPAMLCATRETRNAYWQAWGRSFKLWLGR